MADYKSFLISNMQVGLDLSKEPWLIPADAFAEITNGFLYKGVLTKRLGHKKFAQLEHWAVQDYTTYVETDVGANRATVIADKITITTLDNDEDVWVYKDFGVDYFDGDYVFELDFKCTASSANGFCAVFALSNDLDGFDDLYNAGKHYEAVYWHNGKLKIFTTTGTLGIPGNVGESGALVIGTDYYLTVRRVEADGKIYCDIYSDVNRGTLIETIESTIDVLGPEDYRYLFGQLANGDAGGGGGDSWSGEIRNLRIVTYPGHPVMGIWQYFTAAGSEELLAFDTKRMCRYNSTNIRFEDITLADTWTGADDNFFWCCTHQDKFYITNGVDQVHVWDGATLSAVTMDVDGLGGNDVDTCRMLFSYKSRLVLLHTTEGTNHPQRARWCVVNDPTDWSNDEYVDAETEDWIITADFLGDDLLTFFERTIWKLQYTSDSNLPFIWVKVLETEGAYSTHSVWTFADEIGALGPTGIIMSDGMGAHELSDKIAQFTLETATDKLQYAYSASLDELYQAWLSYASPGSDYPDRILVYNYRGKSFSTYNLAAHVFGFYSEQSDLTWDEIDETWDEIEWTWDERTTQAGYPITLMGDRTGWIHVMNWGTTDDGATIEFKTKSGRWNPFGEQGFKARMGWIDFLVDVDPSVTITVNMYKDQLAIPYKTVDFICTGDGDKVWKRIFSGEVGNFHTMEIIHSGNQQIRIHAIQPWFKEAGRQI